MNVNVLFRINIKTSLCQIKENITMPIMMGCHKCGMEYIGGLLRQYRYDTMLSREDFAKEDGISQSLLERIETGKNVNILSLFRLCDKLRISPSELFQGVD